MSIYTISLYDAHMKCKSQNHKSCKTHFRETSTLKTLKIVSASFRDCSPVQVFDSYVQTLHSEYDNIKNRNSLVEQAMKCSIKFKFLPPPNSRSDFCLVPYSACRFYTWNALGVAQSLQNGSMSGSPQIFQGRRDRVKHIRVHSPRIRLIQK